MYQHCTFICSTQAHEIFTEVSESNKVQVSQFLDVMHGLSMQLKLLESKKVQQFASATVESTKQDVSAVCNFDVHLSRHVISLHICATVAAQRTQKTLTIHCIAFIDTIHNNISKSTKKIAQQLLYTVVVNLYLKSVSPWEN